MRPDLSARTGIDAAEAQAPRTTGLNLTGKVVDLTLYRALRSMSARQSERPRGRYVLWYPGVGCFYPR